jgi:lipopolysaccharide export system protein LptC
MSHADAAGPNGEGLARLRAAYIPSPLPRLDAFRQASVHSERVRVLKMVLPVAGFLLAGLFVFTILQASAGTPEVVTDDSAIADGHLVMALPKLKGFTKEGRAYNVDADQATQALSDDSLVHLNRIDATLPVEKAGWLKVQSPAGVYNRKDNVLTLDGQGENGIRVVSSDNMTVFMSSAVMDLAAGTLKATDNVDVTRREGAISSQEATYSKDGKTLVFEKKVRMTVDPRAGGAPAGQTPASQTPASQ